ncbi:MAG TPA: CoA pyrophosphatase [Nocardioidaceae bacterium]|nr:CoA pyrophosphatase [Nocardioidaceae bacterium]
MTDEELAALLIDPADAIRMKAHGRTEAAVLVPLFPDPDEGLVAVLTERRHDLRKHAGEISFPGGRRDPGEDLVTTALREAEEEIGLPRDRVRLLGALAPTKTLVTSYCIFPFVGAIDAGHDWLAQETEVAHVLELPLRRLQAHRRFRPLLDKGLPVPTVSFLVDGHLVWGATARMLDQLLKRLGPFI